MIAEVNDGETKLTKPAWYQTTAKYAQSNPGRSLWQIFDTLVPYLALWAAMVYTVQTELPYWITLTLAVVAGGVLVRIFIFFHDCCHGSFFASRRANTILGYVTGILTFTPFEHWRHTHNRHHATTGDLDRRGVGDVRTMTTEEYLAAPLLRRFAYRCYRNPFIFFGPGAALLFLCFNRFSRKDAGQMERRSVLRTNMALLFVVGLATWTIGFRTYLQIQLPIILIAGSLGLSYFKLPKILQWFSGNIGLHHIHHVRPNIPNYNLQRCHDEIPAFHTVNVITLGTSLRSLQLGLCDEKSQTLVSFRSLKARGREADLNMI